MSKRYQHLLSPNHIIRKEMKAARLSLLPPPPKTEINGAVLKFLLGVGGLITTFADNDEGIGYISLHK